MTVSLDLKFYNQIYFPAIELINSLAGIPFAMEPESNKIIHQFEGLVLHANHFAEKNNIENFEINKDFRDMANSIKHLRHGKKNEVAISSAVMYESSNGLFRFMRNTITATYANGIEFDAIESICIIINKYLNLLAPNRSKLKILESVYYFYNWAFMYIKPEMSGLTSSSRLIIVKKTASGYIKCDTSIKCLVLYEHCIGQEITQFFPDESGCFIKDHVFAYFTTNI